MRKDISILYIEIAIFVIGLTLAILYMLFSLIGMGQDKALSDCLSAGHNQRYCESIMY